MGRRLYPPPKEVLVLHRWRRRLKRGDKMWVYSGFGRAWQAKFSSFRVSLFSSSGGPLALWAPPLRKTDGLAFTNIWFKMPWGRFSKWRAEHGDAHFPVCASHAFFPIDPTRGKGLRLLRAYMLWERKLQRRERRAPRPDPLHQYWTPKWLPEHLQRDP